MGLFDTWGRTHAITIDNTEVSGSGSHTDLPVLITLDNLDSEVADAGSNSALNGGGDIRFTSDAAGNTRLSLEVVDFVTNASPASQSCEMWVKVPSVSTSSNTLIYIWYNKAGESQPAVGAAFGRNAVWADRESEYHFQDLNDSAGNANLTANGGASVSGGVATIGSGSSFTTATSNQLEGTDNFAIHFRGNTGNLTGTSTTYHRIINYSPGIAFGINTVDTGVWNQGWTHLAFSPADDTEIDCWLTYDGSTYRMYNDGVEVDTAAKTQTPASGFGIKYVGNISATDASKFWPDGNGNMDELAIIHSTISSDWIATEYNNQSSPASFASPGTPSTPGGGGGGRIMSSLASGGGLAYHGGMAGTGGGLAG